MYGVKFPAKFPVCETEIDCTYLGSVNLFQNEFGIFRSKHGPNAGRICECKTTSALKAQTLTPKR